MRAVRTERDPPAPELHSNGNFTNLFEAHAREVLRALRYLGVAASDLEDVTQEVFLVVHRRLGDFVPQASPKAWILGIATKVASEYRRKAFRRYEFASATPHQQAGVETRSEKAGTAQIEARESLIRLLSVLDEKKRTVLVLHEVEGLAMQEIAQISNCELQTAYSRLRRAREAIHREARRLGMGEDS